MDTEAVLDLIHRVADEVINPRFRALTADQIIEKDGPGDLVTVADREAEQAITSELVARIPGCVVIGEEATFEDPTLLDKVASAPHAFLVDPIDGTKNFTEGKVEHAVMVAELKHGVTTRSWIHQPALGHDYVAELGGGAWCDGVRLAKREPVEGTPRGRTSRTRVLQTDTGGQLTFEGSKWCCGVDYPDIAQGTNDFLIYLNNKPWDHAPGALLVAEAGGGVYSWTGSPYAAGNTEKGLLAVGHPSLLPTVKNLLDLRIGAA
ncbi:inositol monophosphatase family protein [Propionibacteriaceae bacterium G1746]|uniref:inositol monophosphatase family protein n=1 Tax=Aestuariimicrobium sp. G57 TaxID=3418485 RepID=UPI003C1B926E